MIIKNIVVGPIETNCYIVKDEESGEGVVIDPGFSPEKIIREINKLNVKIKYIFLTHAHFDHFFAAKEIVLYTNAKIVLNKNDRELIDISGGYARFFNEKSEVEKNRIKPDILIDDGDIIKVGKIEFKFIGTPGHSKGSCCILAGKSLFSGDTLFFETVGRTDFSEGSMQDMLNSLKEKLYPLSDDIDVYPGHGEFTNMGYEKKNNIYFGM